jgi:hypothetical protein
MRETKHFLGNKNAPNVGGGETNSTDLPVGLQRRRQNASGVGQTMAVRRSGQVYSLQIKPRKPTSPTRACALKGQSEFSTLATAQPRLGVTVPGPWALDIKVKLYLRYSTDLIMRNETRVLVRIRIRVYANIARYRPQRYGIQSDLRPECYFTAHKWDNRVEHIER